MDDNTMAAVLAAVQREVTALLTGLVESEALDLETAEGMVQTGVQALGERILAAGVAARGTGKAGSRLACPCGGTARCEGYRVKGVQTLVGWVAVRRAYYWCPACGQGHCPLDAELGVARDSHSPGLRRIMGRLGALLPFAQAAATLAAVTSVHTSASTVRTVTEAVGAQRERELTAAETRAWRDGLPPGTAAAPARLTVAMDGVRILGAGGDGKEAKVGVIQPVPDTASGATGAATGYVASFAPATAFGRRLVLEAHRRGLEEAAEVVVLGDGAEWIWQLAAEHFPTATHIVDWFHASERIWALGRARSGEGTAQTRRWVERQLARLAQGEVADLVRAWQRLRCTGEAATVRDEQVTYFTNQASRMAYARYRARGLEIGSGMVESACKLVIGAREKGPGMRWSVPGAQAVANIRVLVLTDQWDTYDLAA